MTAQVTIELNPDFELVDTWKSESLGEVKVFLAPQRNQYILKKDFRLATKFGTSPQENFLLEARIKELPEEVTLASSNYQKYDPTDPLFDSEVSTQLMYMDYSSMNMRKQMLALRDAGISVSDYNALGFYGFLMGLGSFMEQGMEFHRSVCLKNLLIVDGQLKLTNPYISDSHVGVVIEDFIRPIIAMGDNWTPNLFLDDQKRVELSKIDPRIRQVNELHRAYVRQMHMDSCLVFLGLANMREDNDYMTEDGRKKIDLIQHDLNAIAHRFDPELISIVESVLLNEGEAVPTFIEVNERISLNLRDQLVQAAAISRDLSALVDDGYKQPAEQSKFDAGNFDHLKQPTIQYDLLIADLLCIRLEITEK